MDNRRLFTWALFGMLALWTWQAWQKDYSTPPSPQTQTQAVATSPAGTVTEPANIVDDLPSIDDLPQVSAQSDELPIVEATPAAVVNTTNYVRVKTDVFDILINPVGGDIVSAKLPRYPVAKDRPDAYVEILSTDANQLSAFRSGLTGTGQDDEPNHRATFVAAKPAYELANGQASLVVPLVYKRADGLRVVKRYKFERGSYRIDLSMQIDNGSTADWAAVPYARIVHVAQEAERSMFNVDSYSFKGPVVYDGSKYEKQDLDDIEEATTRLTDVTGGWVAAIEHHFLSAIVPPSDQPTRLEVGMSGGMFVAGTIAPRVSVAAGETDTVNMTFFAGPKLQSQLEEISSSLPLTVDYGILTVLADPLFWLLSKVFEFVGNWGWTIILVTLMIKLAFYKLTEKSGRSIAKMRELQPRLKAIQERYKEDRPKLSQAMMELYKREKVNPAAGCLPVLIQMPFFLAFYWVLLESVEMRQAPFLLWIQDLSTRDPWFVLPFLMGAAMLFQQRLNPAPPDPVQAKVMKVLPIVFTVFFAFFPAGLVLYWLTNTVLGVAQQWNINRKVEAERVATKH